MSCIGQTVNNVHNMMLNRLSGWWSCFSTHGVEISEKNGYINKASGTC